MYKKFLVYIALLFAPFALRATHFVGGEITYTTNGNGVYNVQLTMYKDCAPGTASYPNYMQLYMRNLQTNSLVSSTYLYPGSIQSVPNNYNSDCAVVPYFCVSKRVYSGTIYYPGSLPNGFELTFTDCCRNNTISNIVNPGNSDMTYKVITYPGAAAISNSTPVFTGNPPTVVSMGKPTTVHFPAVDADGDSLYYEFTSALSTNANTNVSYVSGYSGTYPLPSSPPASIDGATGTISMNLLNQGQYVVAVAVTEYRNGVPLSTIQRDYQFNVAVVSEVDLLVDSTYTRPIGCNGEADGYLKVYGANGTLPYNYLWNNGDVVTVQSNLGPGTYQVWMEDAKGCKDSITFQLADPPTLSVDFSTHAASCAEVQDGAVAVQASGGRLPYTYMIDSVVYQADSLFGLAQGTHTLTVYDSAMLCQVDTTFFIEADSIATAPLTNAFQPVSCAGANDGQLSVTLASGTLPFSITWNTGDTSQIISGLSAGNYWSTLIDGHGCTVVDTFSLVDPPALEWTISEEIPCEGVANGTLSVLPTGGRSPYAFWVDSVVQAGLSVVNVGSATYHLQVTDSAGLCHRDTLYTLAADTVSLRLDSAYFTGLDCAGDTSGALGVAVTSGQFPWTFVWNTQATTQQISGLGAGTYWVEATTALGCKDTIDFELLQPAPLTVSWTTEPASCIDVADGSVDILALGGRGSYSYEVDGQLFAVSQITGLSAGAHTLTLWDSAQLCQIDTSFEIARDTMYAVMNPSWYQPVSCHGSMDGSLAVSVTGGKGSLNFLWSSGSTDSIAVGLGGGDHWVTVTDSAGCSFTLGDSLVDPPALEWTISEEIPCEGVANGEISLHVLGGRFPYTYLIDSTTALTPQFTNLQAGSYHLQVTDSAGLCYRDTLYTLAADTVSLRLDSAYFTGLDCAGDTSGALGVTVTSGQFPWTFVWNTQATTQQISGLGAGTYWVEATTALGCKDTIDFELLQPAPLTLSWTTEPASCIDVADGSVDILALGGRGSYSYEVDGQLFAVSQITGLSAGAHTLTLWDSAQLCQIDTSFEIARDTIYAVMNPSGYQPVSCHGGMDGSLAVSVTGGKGSLNFLWSSGSTDSIAVALGGGDHWVTVTDSAGCSFTLGDSLVDPPALEWTISEEIPCEGVANGTLSVLPTGGRSPYAFWVDSVVQAGLSVVNVGSATYHLQVTDSAGLCHRDTLYTLVADTLDLQVDGLLFQPVSCHGAGDGTLGVQVATGIPPFSYQWLGMPDTSAQISGLSAGTYWAVVTNERGCQDSVSQLLIDPPSLVLNALSLPATCDSSDDASISATAVGGRAPYQFLLNGVAQQSLPITGLPVGSYVLTVLDSANLCQSDTTLVLTASNNWNNATVGQVQPQSCYYLEDGSISIVNPSAYDVNWSNGMVNQNQIANLAPGEYVFQITSPEGCSAWDTVFVPAADTLKFNPIISEEQCYGDGSGSINLQPTGGTPPYSVQWLNPALPSASFIFGTQIGHYYPTLTDANGCVIKDTVEVLFPDSLTLELNAVPPLSCGSSDGTIFASVQGGVPPYSYMLNGSASSAYLTNLSYGTYEVTATDSLGCTRVAERSFEQAFIAVYIPNTFTPNADGINELFKIGGDPSCFTRTRFEIFDRWGNKVFETEQPFAEFWDGTWDGVPQEQGHFSYRFFSEQLQTIGNVFLLL